MQTKTVAASLLTLGLCSLSHADVIGVKADASYWNFEGESKTESLGQPYDLDRQGTVQLSVAFEHPIPLLPNAKIKYVNLDSSSEQKTFVNASDVELKNIDYILYYELLDTIVHADVGAGVANLDGTVKNLAVGNVSQYDFSEYTPLVYAQAALKLPFTGASAKAEVVYSQGSDIKRSDIQAELQYDFIDNLLVDVGAKVGYRIMNIEVEQKNLADLELEFKGPYIGVDIHF